MKRPKNYKEACKILGKDPNVRPDYSMLPKEEQQYHNTRYELEVIGKAVRGTWEADYSNNNQPKWYPWFVWDKSVSAFQFYVAYFVYTFACAGSGSRQVFETEEDAIWFGETFVNEYNIILTAK